jgi:class 3 adenylate cyclase/tetratricopeptide (TPR) repeat protein
VVTVLFCDVSGSTELGETLDPETLRALLARYFDRMSAIVERHGGTVEKFIGDAVMAVFGVPVVHEDDALRALRAAVEMRDAFPELGIEGRIGVTTGEVVTGTEERLATGDAVNVAARLEQAARPGEILVGEETYRLARDAADVEPVEPLKLKGKAEVVPAYRLSSVHGAEGFARRLDAPMVGRDRERRMLADAWERVVSERACHLFTILGPAGVGKSRLAAEFLGSLGGALVVRGRCLPYGEGITYWPVVEIAKQLPETVVEAGVDEAMRALVGDRSVLTSSEEIAWAFRKQLEAVAADAPLVCVFDDVHWGEQTFLDLVEHVADLSRDAPILLLCMARPELLDRRAGWAGGKVNATNVLLEPLGEEETDRLISSLADFDESLRGRIRSAAEGNPLFVEEIVAMVRESPGGDVTVPPTIQALLAARLDQLDDPERNVLERGAVEGRVFHRGAVQALAPDVAQVGARLTSLVRKVLVRPDKAQLPGEDAFRFRHLLIRDAAYDALPKATRAELHECFATWLEEHGRSLVEVDEILGYHLEQAVQYRTELGMVDEEVARRAARRLAAAGRRAVLRGDMSAGAGLLGRSLGLRPASEDDAVLELDLADALFWSGRPAESMEVLQRARDQADTAGDERTSLLAQLMYLATALNMESSARGPDLRELAERAIPVFEQAGDRRGLAYAWFGISQVHHGLCRFALRNEALERALGYAIAAGDERSVRKIRAALNAGYLFGPGPADEGLRWFDTVESDHISEPWLLAGRASLHALQGHQDVARDLLREARERCGELGLEIGAALNGEFSWYVQVRAGDPEAAASALQESCRLLDEMGERGWLSTQAGELGHVLCDLGRYDEAEEWAGKSAALGAADDIITQMLWRQILARVRAHEGAFDEAERLAREAVAYGDETDMLTGKGLAHLDLAEVLVVAGRAEEAGAELEQAVALFEQKGDVAMAGLARTRFDRLGHG